MAFIVQNMTQPMVKEQLEVCSTAGIRTHRLHGTARITSLAEPTSSWRNIWRSYPTARGAGISNTQFRLVLGMARPDQCCYPSLRTIAAYIKTS